MPEPVDASRSVKDRTGLWLAVVIAWSMGVAVVYALFPSSDTNAVIAEAVWIVGFLVWLIAGTWSHGE